MVSQKEHPKLLLVLYICYFFCEMKVVLVIFVIFIVGSVYFVDDKGRATQCFTADGAVKFLLYSEGKDMIVVVTDGLILSQHRVAHDGTTSEVAKVSTEKPLKLIFFFIPSIN